MIGRIPIFVLNKLVGDVISAARLKPGGTLSNALLHPRRAEVFALPALHVKSELHHVSVLDDILFSFDTELACFSGFRK